MLQKVVVVTLQNKY